MRIARRAGSTPSSRRSRQSRGAVLVEFVLVLPFLALVVFGIVEYGFASRDQLTVANAVRQGARTASNAPGSPSADWVAVSAVRTALAEIPRVDVGRMVVYKANSDGSPVDARCLSAGQTSGIANACNVYPANALLTAGVSSFQSGAACDGTKLDGMWCPQTRVPQVDNIGVYVEVRRRTISGILGPTTLRLRDRAVMRLEPKVA